MSRINDLIKELCPNGVEYKKLEDCCNILDNKRKPVSKGVRENGEYPYYGANGIQDYINDYIFDGEYVLVGEDGSVQTANGTPVVNWAVGKIWVNNHAHIIEEIDGVSLRYLYHYLQIVDVKDLIHGNIPKLNQGDFRNIKIAIPPLEVQEEIVKILDKFGELEAELEAELEVELEARKNQYEFWLDKLLNNTNNYKKLGEICSTKTGSKPKEILESGSVEYINAGTSNSGYTIQPNAKGDCVTTPSRGQGGIGFVGYQINDFWCGPLCYQIRSMSEQLSNRYLYYFMSANSNYIIGLKHEGGVPAVNAKELQEMPICVPALEEQQRIVNILDRFDKLINDITAGLSTEIELRRNQYEYYRNKLLDFEVFDEKV